MFRIIEKIVGLQFSLTTWTQTAFYQITSWNTFRATQGTPCLSSSSSLTWGYCQISGYPFDAVRCECWAFDTIDYEIPLQRPYVYVGLLGNLLRWLTSFFQDSLLHGCPYSSNKSPFVLVEPSTLHILPEMCLCSTFSMAL